MKEDVIVVDILAAIVAAVAAELLITVDYTYGQDIQIFEELQRKTLVNGVKYPLFAIYMPFPETRGVVGLYSEVTIRKIVIATLTNFNDETPVRYTKTFKPILYPCYYSFLRNLARSPYHTNKNPDAIVHTKYDVPGVKPITGMTDYVDLIQLENLKLNISQKKTYK